MSEKHLTDQKFNDLNLVDSLKKGISDAGFEYCTPIQEKSLPVVLDGKDVAGQAQTGTGKTVAFLLGCCQYLVSREPSADRKPGSIRALILAPTRELAIQIHDDAKTLAAHTDLKIGLIYGGTGYDEQKEMLARGMDILIGTPGRLIDFYKQRLFDLNHTDVVVLDEADRMFDLGFIKDIRFLLRKMPKPEDRLNMLFSATLSFRVMELAYEHMNNPEEIKIDADVRVAEKIEEYSYYPADVEKPNLLINLLKRNQPERVLVFVNTRHGVEEVANILSANDITNAALSGDVPQKKRETLLDGFKSGKYTALVATDVAARGLHIPRVDQVFNYDLPQDAEDYVHRIGRTGRAGQSGEAIGFICEKYAYSIMEIESYIGHSIPKRDIDPELLTEIAKPERRRRDPKSRKNERDKKSTHRKNKPIVEKQSGRRASSPVKEKRPVAEIVPEMVTDTLADAVPVIDSDIAPSKPANETTAAREAVELEQDNGPVSETGLLKQDDIQPDSSPDENTDIPENKPVSRPAARKSSPGMVQPQRTPERFSKRFGEVPLIG